MYYSAHLSSILLIFLGTQSTKACLQRQIPRRGRRAPLAAFDYKRTVRILHLSSPTVCIQADHSSTGATSPSSRGCANKCQAFHHPQDVAGSSLRNSCFPLHSTLILTIDIQVVVVGWNHCSCEILLYRPNADTIAGHSFFFQTLHRYWVSSEND